MPSDRKNFRFQPETLYRLNMMHLESGKNHTQLIEAAIQYVHGEYLRAIKGMDHDELAICQVLGKPIVPKGVEA